MHDFRIIVDPCFRPKFAFVSPDTIPHYSFTPPLFDRFAAAPSAVSMIMHWSVYA